MNDITALIATLKRAAQEELMCREASDTSDLWQDEASPENILALVEALEKAQRANTAQDDHINQQQDRIDTLEKRNAELGKYVAELESRTVTVRLPDINEFLADVHDKTLALAFRRLAEGVRAGDVEEMRAAGIRVIEGEGQ
ncbi:hypothetical protein BKM35_22250 [Salmonella enterica]|nr:hypothetical protein [Salmonella enterica]